MLRVQVVALDALARRLHHSAGTLERLAGAASGALSAAGAAVTDPAIGATAQRAAAGSRAELGADAVRAEAIGRGLALAAERYRELDTTLSQAQRSAEPT